VIAGTPPVAMRVPPGSSQVDVYTASLDPDGSSPDLWGALSPDEQARADRYATPRLRRRFIVARGILRRLLAGYLSIEARDIVFGYGDKGKPFLPGAAALAFNLSHAEDLAIYAIASDREVGIDIESTERDVDIDGMARTAFSPSECEALAALAPDARRAAFFRVWTRKEAYIKARGNGFSYPTRAFSVAHDTDDDALISDETDIDARLRWRVIGLDAPPGFTAALSAAGRDWSTVGFDTTESFRRRERAAPDARYGAIGRRKRRFFLGA
jgi:4'-phosphopantetheinyl transferase